MGLVQVRAQETQATQVIAFGNLEFSEDNLAFVHASIKTQRRVDKDNLTLIFIGGFTDDQGHVAISDVADLKKVARSVYLIPGDHEWNILGPEGVRHLDDKLGELKNQDIIIPDNACGEIETKALSDQLELLTFDSEWVLRDWNDASNINQNCLIKNRDHLYFHLDDEFGSVKEKSIILALYHPPFRFDSKSGKQTIKDHIFPFTSLQKQLYIPLPYIGTLVKQTESYLRNAEFSTHPRYRKYSEQVYRKARAQKKTIVLTADADQTFATIQKKSLYLNVNSRSKQRKPVVRFDGNYTTTPAGVSILYSPDKFDYWGFDLNQPSVNRLFEGSQSIPKIIADEMIPDSFAMNQYGDYTKKSVFVEENLTELEADLITGQLNTGLYTIPVEVPVLNLQKTKLTPIKIGGGQQTTSVRLKDREDNEFVIRSLRKNPDKLLPRFLRVDVARNLLSYYFTSANPFSFLTLHEMEKQLGLLHSTPSLHYIPYQKQLAPYNDEIGDQLVLLADRLDGDRSESAALKYSPSLIGTDDMIEEYLENDLSVAADYYLKNRLLDLLTGDWDRHEDQWRWAKAPSNQTPIATYFPVARDRDQAMSNFDGLVLTINRHFNPYIRPMRPFDDDISKLDVRWQSISGHRLDQLILSHLETKEWNQITSEFKNSLDKPSVHRAIDALPENISTEKRTDVERILQARVDQINKMSDLFRKEINDDLYILASTKDDSIFVDQFSRQSLQIKIVSKNDQNHPFIKFHRIIKTDETKNIYIYGLEGDDVFHTNIKFPKPKIKLIGGFGDDIYIHHASGKSKAKVLEAIDKDEDQISEAFSTRLSSNRNLESFTRYDILPTYLNVIPLLKADRDDRLFLGLTAHWYVTKLKRKIHHYLGGSISTRRASTAFNYGFENRNTLSGKSYFVELNADGPRYNFNFHGLGNESKINTELDREFFFVRRNSLQAKTGVRWDVGAFGQFETSLFANRVTIDTTVSNRYINQFITEATTFEPNGFIGTSITLSFKNLNDEWLPTDGIKARIGMNIVKGLNNNQNHIKPIISYEMYKSLDYRKRYIYSTRIQYTTLIGKYFFYHAPSIGGSDNLRGWRLDRFRGRSAFSHNNNMHIKLIDRKRRFWIPASLGLTASFDYGRVWEDHDMSNRWHTSWGCGLWLSPLNAFVFSASVHTGGETTELRATLGWQL